MKSYTDQLALAASAGKLTFGDVPGFFLFGVITLVILIQVPSMAAGLAGGLSLSTGGAPTAITASGVLGGRWTAGRALNLGKWTRGKLSGAYRARRSASSATTGTIK